MEQRRLGLPRQSGAATALSMTFELMKHTIFLVEDHPVMRGGLAQVINQQADLSVCGEAADTGTALRLIPQVQPELAVVDLSLGGKNGLELIKDLRAVCPIKDFLIQIQVLSQYQIPSPALHSLTDGACQDLEACHDHRIESFMSLRYLIQEHQNHTHYFVFRLEKDGELQSWILPKGVPKERGEKRLAIQVENQASAYGWFEGTVPPGEYGVGTVRVWDKGNYDLHEWTPEHIEFKLKDRQVEGAYSLDRFPSAGTRGWLLSKQE